MKRWTTLATVGLAALAGTALADTETTRAFGEARLAAFASGDIEALLDQYADTAVILAPDGVHATAEARRGFVAAVLAAMAQPDLTFEVIKMQAEGDVLHLVWRAETGTVDFGIGVETYLLQDGRAVYHTEFNQPVAK